MKPSVEQENSKKYNFHNDDLKDTNEFAQGRLELSSIIQIPLTEDKMPPKCNLLNDLQIMSENFHPSQLSSTMEILLNTFSRR